MLFDVIAHVVGIRGSAQLNARFAQGVLDTFADYDIVVCDQNESDFFPSLRDCCRFIAAILVWLRAGGLTRVFPARLRSLPPGYPDAGG